MFNSDKIMIMDYNITAYDSTRYDKIAICKVDGTM